MCNPKCPHKTDTELAQSARRHLQGYDAAVKELQRRGYVVKPGGYASLEIYTTKKEYI